MRLLRRVLVWMEDRSALGRRLNPLLKHKVPPGTGWYYVLGSAILVCLLLQVGSGIALATMYVPSAGEAYASLGYITNQAVLGRLLRGIHFFGASAMIVLLGAHMIRVFLTGSFKFPRELSWVSGVLLLGLTLAMGFSGQILRWDEDGVWGMVVAAEQAGRVPFIGKFLARFLLAGDHVGASTLSHIFAYHVFLIPLLLLAVVGFHLYLVLQNGISEPPRAGASVEPDAYREEYETMLRKRGVPFFPDAAWRDVVFGVLVAAVVVSLAWYLGPKALGNPPDPSVIDAEPRPDWYLLWYFAVLALLPHGTEKYLIWLLPGTAGMVLLGLPFLFPKGERHPARRPWAWLSVAAILIAVGVLTRLGLQSPWSPDFSAEPLPAEVIRSSDPAVVRGAELFHDRGCEYCHSVGGHGGIRGPDLTHVGDDLPLAEIKDWIANGGTNMPAFLDVLDTEEINSLAAFLASRTRSAPGRSRGPGSGADNSEALDGAGGPSDQGGHGKAAPGEGTEGNQVSESAGNGGRKQ